MKNTTKYSDKELPSDLKALFEDQQPASSLIKELSKEPLDLESDYEFVASRLKADIVEQIIIALEEQGLKKNQLAEMLGKSRQWISRVLNEGDNFTVTTIAKLACALSLYPQVTIAKRESKANFFPNSDEYCEIVQEAALVNVCDINASKQNLGTEMNKIELAS